MNILVTGTNGGYGKLALEYLVKNAPSGVKLFGLVRKAEDAQEWQEKGVEIRIGDYTDLPSMEKALKDIDRLLFVSVPYPNIQKNVVEAAKKNGVKFIAYTSIFGVEGQKGGLEINHSQTEQWIKESGIAYSFLRNNWYYEVHEELAKLIQKTGKLYHYASDKPISGALKKDYAEVGARVILGETEKPIIELSNTPYTYAEFAQAIGEIYGKEIQVKAVSQEDAQAWLQSQNLTQLQYFIVDTYQNITALGNNGEDRANPTEFEQILGRKLPNLVESMKAVLKID